MLSPPAVQPQPKGCHGHPSAPSSTAFPACWQPVLDRALLTSCVRRGGRCPSAGLPFPDGASLGSLNSSFSLLSPGWKPRLELPQHKLVVICPLLLWLVLNPAMFRGAGLCFAACDPHVPQPSHTPSSRGCHVALPAPRGTVWGSSLHVPARGVQAPPFNPQGLWCQLCARRGRGGCVRF